MAKEKEQLPVEKKAPKMKKYVSEKKADKNELKEFVQIQKKELLPKIKEIADLRKTLKGKTKEEQAIIRKKIAIVTKDKNAFIKIQQKELKKKKKEIKHKYKIAIKAKKREIKELKVQYNSNVKEHKKKTATLKVTAKGKDTAEKKLIQKNIKAEEKNLKELTKEYKSNVNALKKEIKKLKKNMKKPKGRVKVVPITLLSILCIGIFVFTTFFLDFFLKNIIITTVENAYGAKCDIERVDFEFIESYFLVEKFTLANKDEPMKNLFEFSRMNIDFDLTQLLLAKFVSDEISLEGFVLGTERSISGELPKKQQEKIAKKKKESAEKKADSEFYHALDSITANIGTNSTNFIQDTVNKFNPENILDSYREQLTLPGMVEESKKSIAESVSYWEKTIPDLEKQRDELSESTEELIKLMNEPNITPSAIKEGVETSTKLFKESEVMYKQLDELFENIEKDSTMVKNLTSDISTAVTNDTNFVTTEIDKIVSFDMSDAEGLISSMVESYIVTALGEYYPLLQKCLGYLDEVTSRFDNTTKKEEKRSGFERLKGQNIVFNQQMPSFLIKKIVFSGSDVAEWLTFEGYINDITHQPDLIGKPATGKIEVSIDKYDILVDALVDIRTNTTHDLVELSMEGYGLDTDFLKQPTTIGVPSVDGKMGVDGGLNIGKEGNFVFDAKLLFDPVFLSSATFEPSDLHSVYNEILATINEFYLNAIVGFSFSDGIVIDLETDADKKIASGLETALNNIMGDVKDSVEKDIKEYLESYTNQFENQLSEFTSAKAKFDDLKADISRIQADLTDVSKIEEKIKSEIDAKIQEETQKAKEEVAEKFEDSAKEALGNLFNRKS